MVHLDTISLSLEWLEGFNKHIHCGYVGMVLTNTGKYLIRLLCFVKKSSEKKFFLRHDIIFFLEKEI